MNDTYFGAAQQQWLDFWKKAVEEQTRRAELVTGEWGKIEGKSHEQVSAMVDEMAKLTKESLAYQAQLGAEWRKMWLEATKKSVESMTPTVPAKG
jgi:hypothetical protein